MFLEGLGRFSKVFGRCWYVLEGFERFWLGLVGCGRLCRFW